MVSKRMKKDEDGDDGKEVDEDGKKVKKSKKKDFVRKQVIDLSAKIGFKIILVHHCLQLLRKILSINNPD